LVRELILKYHKTTEAKNFHILKEYEDFIYMHYQNSQTFLVTSRNPHQDLKRIMIITQIINSQ